MSRQRNRGSNSRNTDPSESKVGPAKSVKGSRASKEAKAEGGAKAEVPDRGLDSGLRRGAISIFILFNLIAIGCWALPWSFPPIQTVRELIRPYMLWSGLFQSWDMFAPSPKTINSYVKTVVITRDRHIKVWNFPRMEELSFRERYPKERYRKFAEILPDPQNEGIWPDVANHVARMFNSPDDPPDRVVLIQFRADIKPGLRGTPQPTPQPNAFYEDYVPPGALR